MSDKKDFNQETQICPHCAETIKSEALVCRYCRRDIKGYKELIVEKVKSKVEKAKSRSSLFSKIKRIFLYILKLIRNISIFFGIIFLLMTFSEPYLSQVGWLGIPAFFMALQYPIGSAWFMRWMVEVLPVYIPFIFAYLIHCIYKYFLNKHLDNDKINIKLEYFKFYYKYFIPFSYLRNLTSLILILILWLNDGIDSLLKNNSLSNYDIELIKEWLLTIIIGSIILNILTILIKYTVRKGLKNFTLRGFYLNFILLMTTPITIGLTTFSRGEIQYLGIMNTNLNFTDLDSLFALSIFHFNLVLIFWTIPNIYYFYIRRGLFNHTNQKEEVTK